MSHVAGTLRRAVRPVMATAHGVCLLLCLIRHVFISRHQTADESIRGMLADPARHSSFVTPCSLFDILVVAVGGASLLCRELKHWQNRIGVDQQIA